MTPRERMHLALEGGRPDQVPVAPYIWGAEYAWKLLGVPIWEAQHGPLSSLDYCQAIQGRHDLDWVIPLGAGDRFLEGKEVSREGARVIIADPARGRRWEFLSRGHRLVELDAAGQPRTEQAATHSVIEADPPKTKAEVDAWFERHRSSLPPAEAQLEPPERGASARRNPFRERFPDYFLAGGVGAPFHPVAYTLGFEPSLIMLHEQPSVFCYMSERFLKGLPEQCQRLAEQGWDAGFSCDSWASADIISPQTYRDWIGPLQRRVSDELHRVGLKSILYNTGNILPFLPMMKEMGWDALTIEERIKGVEMPIGQVREAVGPRQCLFGNFDAYLLLRGDREAIETEVKRQIETAGKEGAFVMGTGSPICDDTDPQVVDFWIETTRRVGRYG